MYPSGWPHARPGGRLAQRLLLRQAGLLQQLWRGTAATLCDVEAVKNAYVSVLQQPVSAAVQAHALRATRPQSQGGP